jgi:hypothetical protein
LIGQLAEARIQDFETGCEFEDHRVRAPFDQALTAYSAYRLPRP